MIKRGRKKWKSKRKDVGNLRPSDSPDSGNQSRNSSSDLKSGGKERRSRNRKRTKSPMSMSKYPWHRSKSVPSKTVSFCPYVMHRFAQPVHRSRADSCRSHSCARCKLKTGFKKTAHGKRRMAAEKSSQLHHDPESCLQSRDMCNAHEYYQGVAESPGPPKCNATNMFPDSDYCTSYNSGSGHVLNTGLLDSGPSSSAYHHSTRTAYPYCHHGNNCSVGSAYVCDSGATRSPWVPAKRSLHSSPGHKNWGAEAKYDFLMARYSEHNYPRSHPARADYFALQRQSFDTQRPTGNFTQNKSPGGRMASQTRSLSQNRSLSQTRVPSANVNVPMDSSLRSTYSHFDSNYLRTINCAPKSSNFGYPPVDIYQSDAMREMLYDSLSQKYIEQASRRTTSKKQHSDLNTRYHSHGPQRTYFPAGYTPNTYADQFDSILSRGKKFDFADDMKLIGRNFSSASAPLSMVKSGPSQRSRSTDASFLAGTKFHADNDISFQSKYTPATGADKSSHSKFDSWKNTYGNFDSWKTNPGIVDIWKTHGNFDELRPTSASGSGAFKSTRGSTSKERHSGHCLSSDSLFPSNGGCFDNNRSANKKPSSSSGYVKAGDIDSFINDYDESDARKMCDKYTSWCSADTPAPDPMNAGSKRNLRTDTRNSFHGVHVPQSASSRYRDKSLSPVNNRRMPSFTSSALGSRYRGNDFSFEQNDGISKHHIHDSLGMKNGKVDRFSTSSDCKLYNYDASSNNYRSSNSSFHSARNLNMNQSQNSTSFSKIEHTPDISAHSYSWKFKDSRERILNNDSTLEYAGQSSRYSLMSGTPSKASLKSYCFDNSAEMLNSLVDQEASRLKKVAGVIGRQQDTEE